jgi:hypothetical protein
MRHAIRPCRAYAGLQARIAMEADMPIGTKLALALILMSAPGLACARPYAPGKCSTLDDGVDETPATAQMRRAGLQSLSMELPKPPPEGRGLDNAFVADVALTVQTDGSVSNPTVLCTNPGDPEYAKALLQTMPHWSFRLPPGASKSMRVGYRIVIWRGSAHAKTIPLGVMRAT